MEPDERNARAKSITEAVVRITREYTGRGPTKARTYLMPDVAMVVMADTLTKGERALVNGGSSQRVIDTRQEFQQLMRNDLTAAVEQELDRKVLAFMSANHIAPDMATETFVLAPAE